MNFLWTEVNTNTNTDLHLTEQIKCCNGQSETFNTCSKHLEIRYLQEMCNMNS